MLGGRDQKQHAVVLLRLAELPGAEQLIGVGLDVAAFERSHRGDDELDAGLLLQGYRFGCDVAAARRGQDIGLIDHRAGELREIERQGERRPKAKRKHAGGNRLQDPHHQLPDAPPPPDEPPPPEKPPPPENPPPPPPPLQPEPEPQLEPA